MALFRIDDKNKIQKIEVKQFKNERELQRLCESNLDVLFQVKFIATEYPFSDDYSGRLDTLAIDYDGNPVIIEYKFDKNQAVLSQALFYMDWLVKHKANFELEVKKVLKKDIKVKWDNPKMIIIAQEFNKYDKYAINQIDYDIYLYKYVYYKTGEFILENISLKDSKTNSPKNIKSNTNKDDNNSTKYKRIEYDFEYHFKKGNAEIQDIITELNERILGISDDIEVRYPAQYIGYRTTRNFAEVHVAKNRIIIYVLASNYNDPEKRLRKIPKSYRWVSDQELVINSMDDIDFAMSIIRQSYSETL